MHPRRWLFAAFLVSLWLPLLAVALSPRFADSLRNLVQRKADWSAEKDGLRRSTPLWNGAVSLYDTLLYRFGASGNHGVAVVGRDGWVFLGDAFDGNFSQAIGRRTLSDADVAGWSMALRGQAAYLRHEHRAFLVVVAPAKWSVYRDKLPAWSGTSPVTTPFAQLLAVRPALPLVDLHDALVAGRRREDTYSRLNSHWTDFGAYVAWDVLSREIARQLGDPPVVLPPPTGVALSDRGNEFDAMLGIAVPNRWTGYAPSRPLPPYQVVESDGRRHAVPWDTHTSLFDLPRTTENAAAPSPRRVLVLRDSMGDALSPLLQSSFREVIQVGHELPNPGARPDLVEQVEAHQPDLVLLVLTERYLVTPPPRPVFWRLASAFYADDARELAGWTAGAAPVGALRIRGDGDLAAAALEFADDGVPRALTHSAVVQVRAEAVGAGTLMFTLRGPGGSSREQRQDYHAGPNVFLFEWRAGDRAEALRFERAQGSSPIRIRALSIRQQRPLPPLPGKDP